MNRPLLKKIFRQTAAWVGIVALTGVIALAQDPAAPAAVQRTDGQIEMDVVHALDASAALKNDLITAATIQSEVTLAGTVSSQASKDLAASIAGQVAGVTKVNNKLQIGDPQQARNAQPLQPSQSQSVDQGDPGPPAQQVANNQTDDGPIPPPQAYPQQQPQQNQGQQPYPPQGQQQQPYPNQQQQPYPNQQQQPYPGQAQGQYPPQYPQGRPQYAPYPPQRAYNQPPAYKPPSGPVTIPQGTLLQLRTNETVGTKRAQDGQPVQFTVISDVAVGGVLAIPRGATVHGVVTESKKAGDLGGSPVLALNLVSMDLGGQSYPLDSDQFKVKGPNKAGQTAGNAVGGALLGAIIGGAIGRGTGAAIGAGAGAAAGTAASAASPGPGVWIPAEARVDFHINTPLTVQPVDAQEASRLAQGLYQGGPSLYRRPGYYPYGRGYGYYGGYGYYPPVYYRPYFITGGYYYWR
jgi:hypothetical protein